MGDWYRRVAAARATDPATKAKHASLWATHCEPQWAGWPMSAITRMEAQEWANRLQATRRTRHKGKTVTSDDEDVPLLGAETVRGDLDPDVLCADAARYHSIYAVYGISVFAIRGATVDELAQQAPLVRFDRLSLLTVRDVLAAGMRLEPTGRNPRHYTVGFDDLENGVRRRASCPHQVMPNSYHDA